MLKKENSFITYESEFYGFKIDSGWKMDLNKIYKNLSIIPLQESPYLWASNSLLEYSLDVSYSYEKNYILNLLKKNINEWDCIYSITTNNVYDILFEIQEILNNSKKNLEIIELPTWWEIKKNDLIYEWEENKYHNNYELFCAACFHKEFPYKLTAMMKNNGIVMIEFICKDKILGTQEFIYKLEKRLFLKMINDFMFNPPSFISNIL